MTLGYTFLPDSGFHQQAENTRLQDLTAACSLTLPKTSYSHDSSEVHVRSAETPYHVSPSQVWEPEPIHDMDCQNLLPVFLQHDCTLQPNGSAQKSLKSTPSAHYPGKRSRLDCSMVEYKVSKQNKQASPYTTLAMLSYHHPRSWLPSSPNHDVGSDFSSMSLPPNLKLQEPLHEQSFQDKSSVVEPMQHYHYNHHHHRLPDDHSLAGQVRSQGHQSQEPHPNAADIIGQAGMPIPAPLPKGPKSKFTTQDDALLIDLKETRDLSWRQISVFFPGRSSGTLQVRYCTKLKAKKTSWSKDMVERLKNAMHEYEHDRWRIISGRVGGGVSATACEAKAEELEFHENSSERGCNSDSPFGKDTWSEEFEALKKFAAHDTEKK